MVFALAINAIAILAFRGHLVISSYVQTIAVVMDR
jgi:hypothetical protein